MKTESSAIWIATILALTALAPVVSAGNNFWTSTGPDGGIMKVIATDPTSSAVLYSGVQSGGIWKSTDAGASWLAIGGAALAASSIGSIAISPSLPSTLYVAADSSGAWRSTDGGASWVQANNGFVLQSGIVPFVQSLAIDPTHSETVYAGVEGSASNGGVYRTTDGGANWKLSNSSLPVRFDLSVNVVRLDPTDLTDIFIATLSDGVYRSTDSGSTWKKYCDATLDNQTITDVLPFPATNTVFAASAGLYESSSTAQPAIAPEVEEDFEQDFWFNVTDALIRLEMKYPGSLRQIWYGDKIPQVRLSQVATVPTLYVASLDAGMARSTDGGVSWSLINTALPSLDFEALDIDSGDENVVYAGGQGDGIYKTTNAGANWSPSSHGLQASAVNSVAVAPSNPAVVYAGLDIIGGIRRSTDGGATWSIANGTPNAIGNLTVSSIAVDPANPSVVYVTADGDTADAYKSTDGGGHWQQMKTGFVPNDPIYDIAVARSNGAILFAASFSRVYKSTDSGASWKEQTAATGLLPIPEIVAIDPSNASTVYVATNGNSVFRTTDGGTTWAAANNDGGSGFFTDGTVQALAIDPSHSGTLYAGAQFHGIWKTTDGGALWTIQSTGLQDQASYASPVSIVVDPDDSKTVYVATADFRDDPALSGVFVSHDAGASWSPMSTGLSNFNATSLAVAPNGTSPTLYLATNGAGVQALTITAPPGPRHVGGIGASPVRHVGGRP